MGDATLPSQAWRWSFPAEPTSVARARHFLRETLLSIGRQVDTEAVVLMLSELVSNAIQHGKAREVDVAVHLEPAALVVRVGDTSPVIPAAGRPGEDDAGGRGLPLVEKLSEQWGVERRPEGKWVWFRSQIA